MGMPKKPRIQLVIFKLFKGEPVPWDGPYKTEEEAFAAFSRDYENPTGAQDFAVARISIEFLDHRARSKPKRKVAK